MRMAHGTPTLATGKICHLEIPAVDVERSSLFYRDAFGWELRTRADGSIAFDDAVQEVSGSW
jgi:predicted enzyme related to lactoylglutathione lyase